MLMLPPAASSQTREITGTVTIAGSSIPLIGATVSVEGTTLATLTGQEGRFRLTVPSGPQAVTARYIGYRRMTRAVPADQATVDFGLDRDVLQLEGVVVTGQATTVERRSATTSIAHVSGQALNAVAAPTFENAIVGKVSGVNTQSNSGAPGGGIQIQIRGNNTILGSFDPLYVIDGVIVSNDRISGGRASIHDAAFPPAVVDPMTPQTTLDPRRVEDIPNQQGAPASS